MFHHWAKTTKIFNSQELENKSQSCVPKYLRATNLQVRNPNQYKIIMDYTEELKMRWYKEQKEISVNWHRHR